MKLLVKPVRVFAVVLVAVACLQLPSPVFGQDGVKAELIEALQEALESEQDVIVRLYLAKGLIKFAPDNDVAAQELVKGFLSTEDIINNAANQILNEVIQSGPSALVRGLIPLLKHEDEFVRRQTADLLAKIDPEAMP